MGVNKPFCQPAPQSLYYHGAGPGNKIFIIHLADSHACKNQTFFFLSFISVNYLSYLAPVGCVGIFWLVMARVQFKLGQKIQTKESHCRVLVEGSRGLDPGGQTRETVPRSLSVANSFSQAMGETVIWCPVSSATPWEQPSFL